MATPFNRRWKYIAVVLCILGGLYAFLEMGVHIDYNRLFIMDLANAEHSKDCIESSLNNATDNVHVLLVAYPRTGSSFLGQLLTAGGNVFYLYEPSYEFLYGRNVTDVEATVHILSRLFGCDNQTLEMLASKHKASKTLAFYWPKAKGRKLQKAFRDMTQECRSSRIKLAKLIRYGLNAAIGLLAQTDPTVQIRVVHLVRDPRAMLHSLRRNGDFQNRKQTPAYRCSNMRRDLNDSGLLSPRNYLRIRYEDLVSNVLGNVARLYEFIGLPLTDEVLLFMASHKWAERFSDKPDLGKYSTFRTADFDPHSWQKHFTPKELQEIEEHCGDIVQFLKYDT